MEKALDEVIKQLKMYQYAAPDRAFQIITGAFACHEAQTSIRNGRPEKAKAQIEKALSIIADFDRTNPNAKSAYEKLTEIHQNL